MSVLESMVQEAASVAILGHIHPDGDCVGSTLGLWNYLRREYPQIQADVYLKDPSEKFAYLSGFNKILRHGEEKRHG